MVGTVLFIVFGVLGWLVVGVSWRTGRLALRRQPISHEVTVVESNQTAPVEVPFGVALDSITIGVAIAAPSGEIIYRNTQARQPTGAIHSDLLVDEAVERHVLSALAGGTSEQILDLYGPPRRVVSVMATPLAIGGAAILIEDITERALVDAIRTDFVANISHELKTPVGALAVLAEALSQVEDPAVVKRLSTKISDEAIRVGRTIDDLLELSRIEFGGEAVKDVLDVDVVLAEAIGRTENYAESRSIFVTYQPADSESGRVSRLQVCGDRRQLVSALGNLIENAVKYSEPGGEVHLNAFAQGKEVLISIRDFGMGIPAKDIDRIFERFYRVDRARSRETGGTGLGLAIVRHVVTNHGGQVSVSSDEGAGSVFTLTLPSVTSNTTLSPDVLSGEQ